MLSFFAVKFLTMQALLQMVVFGCALTLASCAHNLSEDYPFKQTLNTAEEGGLYELYWTFDNEAETISFAVRVQTTGWVGFGISPNGQMPNSDVVIGWVTDDGQTVFHDRFASRRAPPAIDEQQDWELENGEEENGFTILEFSRKFITCDDDDLPITAETARVIWSFHSTADPTSEDLTSDLIHSEQGSLSLNLLGGLPNAAPEPEDLQYYDVTVDEITIPENDTTYWCAAFRIPEDIRSQTKYIIKFGPSVTEGNAAHVHHLIVYTCTGLNHTHVGNGGECEEGVANEVAECRGGTVIAGWAVGGEDFTFPDNVAFPIGGPGAPEYLVMELHYDNPLEKKGVVDSSGMRLWYTSVAREHDAGTLTVGHYVHPFMVIPPNAQTFTTTAFMTEECSRNFIREEGIHVFASTLHTHVAGRGLIAQHLRYNPECGGYEELEPIEKNLQYDFDFQQINHLRREVTILPGDLIQLKCLYGTEGVDGVTLGGLGTRDEMCIVFLMYYPKTNFSYAITGIAEEEQYNYLSTFPSGRQILAQEVEYVDGLNAVDWDEDARQNLQSTVDNSTQAIFCGSQDGEQLYRTEKFPKIECPYVPPAQCPDATPPTTPVTSPSPIVTEATEDGVVLRASAAVLLVLSLLGTIMG